LKPNYPGRFFAFEGLDGSGTTTQAHLLAKYLEQKGCSPGVVEEPGETALGRKVRELLLEDKGIKIFPISELFLYEVSRSQLVREKLIAELEKGRIIISDRFALSSVAYQGYGRGIPIDQVKALNEVAVDGVEPDLTILLDIGLEDMDSRILNKKPDRIEKESKAFYRRVRNGYLKEITDIPNHIVIDGSLPKEHIHEQVIREVQKKLKDERD